MDAEDKKTQSLMQITLPFNIYNTVCFLHSWPTLSVSSVCADALPHCELLHRVQRKLYNKPHTSFHLLFPFTSSLKSSSRRKGNLPPEGLQKDDLLSAHTDTWTLTSVQSVWDPKNKRSSCFLSPLVRSLCLCVDSGWPDSQKRGEKWHRDESGRESADAQWELDRDLIDYSFRKWGREQGRMGEGGGGA